MLLTREEVACLLVESEDVNQRMTVKGIHSRKADGTVPLGTITCGELIRMNRGLRLLAWQLFPELGSDEVLEELICSAAARVAGGAGN